MKTRIYAIEENKSEPINIDELTDYEFIEISEDIGLHWDLYDFQNLLNNEGRRTKIENNFIEYFCNFEYGKSPFYFRIIDVDFDRLATSENVSNCDEFHGFCLECGDDDLELIDGTMEYQELKCSKGHEFTIKSLGWEYTDNKKIK